MEKDLLQLQTLIKEIGEETRSQRAAAHGRAWSVDLWASAFCGCDQTTQTITLKEERLVCRHFSLRLAGSIAMDLG